MFAFTSSDPTSTILEGQLGFQLLAGLAALIAFIVGLRQYRRGQGWQKAQILLSLVNTFENNALVRAARTMIDWDERQIMIGDKVVHFNREVLASALRVQEYDVVGASTIAGTESSIPYTPEEALIRDAFDTFFDFFFKLESFVRIGLLRFTDLVYFYYWFELLSNFGEYKGDPSLQTTIDEYIDGYNFVGLRRLLREYRRHKREPLSIPGIEEGARETAGVRSRGA